MNNKTTALLSIASFALLAGCSPQEEVVNIENLMLAGHAGPVLSVAFSPDGKRIASGSSDNTIKLWDAQSGKRTQDVLTGHEQILSIASPLAPTARRIASGSSGQDDQTVGHREREKNSGR